jgi:long-subunit acyl-CoA synthetase (AMP-forming)
VILAALPLFQTFGLTMNLLKPLSAGARVVFLEANDLEEVMRAIAERRITVFGCGPRLFYRLHRRIRERLDRAPAPVRLLGRALAPIAGWIRASSGVNLGPVVFRRAHRMLGGRMRLLVIAGETFDPAAGRDLYRWGFRIQPASELTESAGPATPGDPVDRESVEAHYERSPFIREVSVIGRRAFVRPDLDAMRQRRVVNMRELLRFEMEGLSVIWTRLHVARSR